MANKPKASQKPISWERVREIFGNPQPPRVVWERRFDYFHNGLQRLAKTPYLPKAQVLE
jgi:hypothetical protein